MMGVHNRKRATSKAIHRQQADGTFSQSCGSAGNAPSGIEISLMIETCPSHGQKRLPEPGALSREVVVSGRFPVAVVEKCFALLGLVIVSGSLTCFFMLLAEHVAHSLEEFGLIQDTPVRFPWQRNDEFAT